MIDTDSQSHVPDGIFDDPYASLPPLPTATAARMMALAPPEPALLGPLAPGTITLIRGPRAAGKSWLALALARTVASGGAILGWQARQAPVLHVDAAMAATALGARLRALGPPPPDLDLIGDKPLDLGMAATQARFLDELPDRGLLVLDGLSLLVQSGRGARWQAFCTWLRALRQDGLAVLLVDHASRPAVEALADTLITLKPLRDDGCIAFTAEIVSRNALPAADRAFTVRLELTDTAARWSRAAVVDPALREIAEAARQGGTVRDIAERLGLPTATAWRRLGRARALGLVAHVEPGETGETAAVASSATRDVKPAETGETGTPPPKPTGRWPVSGAGREDDGSDDFFGPPVKSTTAPPLQPAA